MDGTGETFTLTIAPKLAAVEATAWDACAGNDNPFLSYAFLSALEDSGSVGGRTGWRPQHLLLSDPAGRLVACAPLYLKNQSYGEYVFDHGWASAYENAGGRYYPKMQCAVPFTPVPGRRLLIHPEAPAEAESLLIEGMVSFARQSGVSSLHVTFLTKPEWEKLGAAGFLQRIGQQFHWLNEGYKSFDDFLGALNSRKRKSIRKERREAVEHGIEIRTLSGAEITRRHWDAFYDFYLSTSDRKWGSAYLNRSFFDLLGERLGDKVVLVMGERNGTPVCGALNLRGADTLYGRNWGALGDFKFLHFEACYYRAIDYAIEHGLARVEAGAQGTHKIQRGYLPAETYSAHWIRERPFAEAIERFLVQERASIRHQMAELATLSPFRQEETAE
ncbi:MAG TPA: GNAT family N-acetyltransferase [Aliidongia sp.]|nr:GNAT family N-acetyltransferase [Aliidongia sp.]